MKILMVMEQCNPEWASVPLVGYNFYSGIRELADVTLVTHERNRNALEKVKFDHRIEYIFEGKRIKRYYGLVSRLTSRGAVNWPLQHALSYPIYESFNTQVYNRFAPRVQRGEYDLVHAMTPILPRYPVKLVHACQDVPFLLGPVNGGVPFPKGFEDVARKEFAHFNFLRIFSRFLPGYAETYRRADRILVGSSYTLDMLQEMFSLDSGKLELFYENGIPSSFIGEPRKEAADRLELIFVGRLVPYKGADMAIKALALLNRRVRARVHLTIVGDGSERNQLEDLVANLGLEQNVAFTGWVEQSKTRYYYQQADIFCFPSIREFGGAVALEAMACGLPCIVVDHGGLGEYVTEKTGFKIKPISRDHITQEIADKIVLLLENKDLRKAMSDEAIKRVQEFAWERKAERMVKIYADLIAQYAKRRESS